jgi:curved DNA-binding protein CbpA
METLYDVLGVNPNADPETIRRAYREGAKRHHPDVSGRDPEQFKRLTTARDVLLDRSERKRYDALGHRRYARYHLGNDWPAAETGRAHTRRRSRPRRSTTARSDRRQTRRTRHERPSRRSGPADGLIALSTYWSLLVRVSLVLTALLALAFVLAVL